MSYWTCAYCGTQNLSSRLLCLSCDEPREEARP
jgi:hypothetical protein